MSCSNNNKHLIIGEVYVGLSPSWAHLVILKQSCEASAVGQLCTAHKFQPTAT